MSLNERELVALASQLLSALNRAVAANANPGKDYDWVVEADDAFVYDQRMIDPRVSIASLKARLPTLSG